MCTLCYDLAGDEHWSDVLPPTVGAVPARMDRARILGRVLARYGLSYHDTGPGGPAQLSDRKGSVELVRNLASVWPAAEALTGRRPDPLDPELLRDLSAERL